MLHVSGQTAYICRTCGRGMALHLLVLQESFEVSGRVSFRAARSDCVAEYQSSELACSLRYVHRALFDLAQSRKYLDCSERVVFCALGSRLLAIIFRATVGQGSKGRIEAVVSKICFCA